MANEKRGILVAAAALEQSMLESKDKDTLLEMAKALGVKVTARQKKADIIDKILDTTGTLVVDDRARPTVASGNGQRRTGPGRRPSQTPWRRARASEHRRTLAGRPRRPKSCSDPMASRSPIGRSSWPQRRIRRGPVTRRTHRPAPGDDQNRNGPERPLGGAQGRQSTARLEPTGDQKGGDQNRGDQKSGEQKSGDRADPR